ncbi:hypothetical protein D3C77_49110 [compost metagenome]
MKIEFNAFDVPPSKLRALAHFLNCLASDAEGKPAKQNTVGTLTYEVEVDTSKAEAALDRLEKLAGNERPDAPSASEASTQAQTAASASAADVGPLDKNGMPWDERIHSSSKNQNADGTWRYLRGGDAEQRAAVEAELRARGYGQVQTEQAPPPPPPVNQVTGSDAPPPPPPVTQAASVDAPPPPPPVVSAPAADGNGDEVTTAMVFKRASSLSKEQQAQALELVGLTVMGDFLKKQKDDPSLIQGLWDAMVAITGEE